MKPASPDGYVCSQCNLPVCEEMCEKGEEHSKECKVLSRAAVKVEDMSQPHKVYWCITTLRLLRYRHQDPDRYAIVERMMDHNEEHSKEDAWSTYREAVVDFLRQQCDFQMSEEEIFHALGVLDVNSVKINSGSNIVNGHGLYPLTSLLSHGCISNSKTVLKSDYSLECKATTFIAQGEEVTKNYVSPLETTQMRREKLRKGWYFDCACMRCQDPTEGGAFVSATRCLRCGDGTILPNTVSPSENSSLSTFYWWFRFFSAS